ncbi:hypothetical protein LTR62_006346 [Meristemomyces frigidus]|uniref:PCI domain-containing protein n=1 Tax=Meristemomyces frigidus TaxID=1508187 RepID=A0AAN7YPX9_9PEZI|nr:hypothetical protein LTR62_006346 [Meristemomyces frigidus]
MGDPQYLSYPLLPLAQSVFALASPSTDSSAKEASRTALQDAIREHKMAPFYAYLAHPQTGKLNSVGEGGSGGLSPVTSRGSNAGMGGLLRRTSSINSPSILGVLGGKVDANASLAWDEKLYEQLKEENEKELGAIAKEEEEALEREGETELQACRAKRAEFYARVGDKEKALEAFEALFEKQGILATKIDIVLAIIRVGLFFDDKMLVKKNVERAGILVESGGDWDRRNRLKAYAGLHLLTIRAYGLGAPGLLDSLSTFTASELCSYSELVVYATLAGAVSLPRRDFKTKVVDAPEIRAIFGAGSEEERLAALAGGPVGGDEMAVDDDTKVKNSSAIPKSTAVNLTTLASGSASADAQAAAEPQIDFSPLSTMISSLYNGNYSSFFRSLATVEENFLTQNRYLYEHRGWFVREMRLRAYQQLLQSYKVVSLDSMATSFDVSVEWLDRDLSPFIASKRLEASIDRVEGRVAMGRSEGKGGQ